MGPEKAVDRDDNATAFLFDEEGAFASQGARGAYRARSSSRAVLIYFDAFLPTDVRAGGVANLEDNDYYRASEVGALGTLIDKRQGRAHLKALTRPVLIGNRKDTYSRVFQDIGAIEPNLTDGWLAKQPSPSGAINIKPRPVQDGTYVSALKIGASDLGVSMVVLFGSLLAFGGAGETVLVEPLIGWIGIIFGFAFIGMSWLNSRSSTGAGVK